jgi:hypothetical protein
MRGLDPKGISYDSDDDHCKTVIHNERSRNLR